MKNIVCTTGAYTTAIAPNSINLVLETCIRIEPQENIDNVLQNVSSFLDNIKYALLPINKDQIRRTQTQQKKYFTNFLNNTVHAILDFEYTRIESFFKSLYNEIKYYFTYDGSAFAEIVKNPLVKRHLEHTLKELSETNPVQTKMYIKYYMDNVQKTDNSFNRLGDFLNQFYDQKDEMKMKRIIYKLKNCIHENDFTKVIRSAVHSLIIKQYDKMNYTVRTEISDEVNRLAELAIKRRFQGDTYVNTTIKTNDNLLTNNLTLGNITKKLTNKNDSNFNITTLTTKIDISTVKETNHEDIKDNTIPMNEDLNVTTVIQNNNTLLRVHDESEITKKNTTITTKQVSKVTLKGLKRFKLKHPIENNNKTATNTSVPQDINDANGTTTVPNIINGTTEHIAIVPKANENGTDSTTIAPTTTTINTVISVPLDVNVTMNTAQVPPLITSATVPILRVKNNKPTKIIKRKTRPKKINRSLKTIPVPRPVKSSKTPGLRVIGKKQNPKLKGKKNVPRNIQKGRNNSKKMVKKHTPIYVPPKAKKILAELAYKKKHPMDIEDKIDMMNIDG